MQHRLLVALATTSSLLAAGCRTAPCPRAGAPVPGPTAAEVSKAPGLQVLLEVHLLDVPEARLAVHLSAGTGGTGSQRVLSGEQAAALVAAARTDPACEVLAMPSVVTTDGEDVQVEVREDDPAKRWSGMHVAVSPRVLSGLGEVEVDVLALRRGRAGAVAAHDRVQATGARLRSQETLILLGAPDAATGRRFLATVRPTLLPARVP